MVEQKQIKKPLEKLELSNKPVLVITEKLKRQIAYLHGKVGSNEWSGELLTREEGTIQDLDDWKIIAEDIFLADVGSPGSTSYEVDKGGFKSVDVAAMFDKFEGLLDGTLKNQHIHTHHSMDSFFSLTDWENLYDRAKVSNYVLMLVVNFAGKYCAKVAFMAKVKDTKESSIEFVNNVDNFEGMVIKNDSEKEILVVMDCAIQQEASETDTWFQERYESVTASIQEENNKKVKSTYKGGKSHQKTMFPGHRSASDWDTWEEPKYNKKQKRISDMTQREWEMNQKEEEMEKVKNKPNMWETRHVFALLNCVLNQNSDMSFISPIPVLSDLERKFRDEKDRNEFLNIVSFTIKEKFDELFIPKNSDDHYLDMMIAVVDFLNAYKYNKLAEDIMEVCWSEIERFEEDDIKSWDKFNNEYENALIQ